MQTTRRAAMVGLMLVAGMLAACGSGPVSTASLGIPAVSELPSLAKMPKLPEAHGQSSLPPIEAYALVARGATSCWFGAGGPLKKSLVFYADADPPSSGGKAEIALLERIERGESPRGARVYRITFSDSAGGTSIEQANQKLPDALVTAIEADVARFARGQLSCAASGPTAPQIEAPVAIAQPVAKAGRKQLATKK